MKYKSFDDYLEVKSGEMKPVTKPPVEEVPDYHGEAGNKDGGGAKPKKLKNIKNQQVREFKDFNEYLTASGSGKGTLKEKPDVKLVADMPKNFPDDAAPPDDCIPKMSKPGKTGKPNPYRATAGQTKKGGSEKGLGDMGSEPAWIPDTEKEKTEPSLGNKKGVPQVAEMSLVEVTRFVNQLNESCSGGCGINEGDEIPMVTAFCKGKFHPNPLEAIKYVAYLAKENSEIMEHLLHNLQEADVLGPLMKKPGTFERLADSLDNDNDGPRHADSLVNAIGDKYKKFMENFDFMNENALGPPIGFDDEDEEPPPEKPKGFGPKGGDIPEDDEEAPDLDDEAPEDEEEDDFGGPGLGEDDDELPDLDDEGEDEEGPEGLPTFDKFSKDKEGDLGDKGAPPPAPPPMRKPKRRFAHNHLINAMKKHDFMRDEMKL